MTTWICDGCGVEHADSEVRPPENSCAFTSEVMALEERGDLPPHGTWTTLAELAAQPHQTEHVDHGRGVHSSRTTVGCGGEALGGVAVIAAAPKSDLLHAKQ